MSERNELEKAIDYAIETDNCLFYEEAKRWKEVEHAKKVCVFGTGSFFKGYHHFLNRIDFVCDNNSRIWGTEVCGYKCISPAELSTMEDTIVIIMVSHYREIKKQLEKSKIKFFYFGDLFYNVYSDFHKGLWFEKNKEKILKVYDLLQDSQSKKIYKEAICLRIAPQYSETLWGEMETGNEYFNSEIFQFGKDEVLVDAGAYNGDSIINFVECVNYEYEHIYAFELEKKNYDEMLQNLKDKDIKKVSVYNVGTSNKSKEIRYNGEGTGTHIAGDGKIGKLDAIDKVIGEKKVTFIKMDVEGAEQESLEGAKKLIRYNSPKLCISAYHRLEDLWEIPLQIISFDNRYKLYMRHHSPLAWDTDCYAALKDEDIFYGEQ